MRLRGFTFGFFCRPDSQSLLFPSFRVERLTDGTLLGRGESRERVEVRETGLLGGIRVGGELRGERQMLHRGMHRERLRRDLGDLYAESGQTLQGSFSAGWLAGKLDYPQKLKVPEGYEKIAVSKPNFASKYSLELGSLESSRRDLHNALLCTFSTLKFCFKNC